MGKWSAFKEKFSNWVDPDEKHRIKVDAAKGRMRELMLDHEDLAEIMGGLRDEKDRLKAAASITQAELDAAEELFVEKLEGMGLSKFTLADGDTWSANPQPHASVSDKDAVREWAMKEGLEGLLAIPWQTLNAMVKEKLEGGDPLPPGVDIFMEWRVTRHKA